MHPVNRLGGKIVGPVIIGQYQYGPKTGLSLAPQPDGSVKILIFKGASSAKTAKGIKYVATDVAVPDHRKLDRMLLEGGFTHHLAVAMADIGDEVRMLFDLVGVPWVSPDA